jgi:hypothetical protein
VLTMLPTSHPRQTTAALTTGTLAFHTAGCRTQQWSDVNSRHKLSLNAPRTAWFVANLVISWVLHNPLPVMGSFSPTTPPSDIVAPSSLVRMLCHMVHMALRMVDEPLEVACAPVYPAPSQVPNHCTVCHLLASATALTFTRSRDLCLACSAHLLGWYPLFLRLHT